MQPVNLEIETTVTIPRQNRKQRRAEASKWRKSRRVLVDMETASLSGGFFDVKVRTLGNGKKL